VVEVHALAGAGFRASDRHSGDPRQADPLADRSKGIEDAFTKLDGEIAETTKKLDEYKAKLAGIEKDIQKRLADAQAEGEKTRQNLMAEAVAAAAAEGEKAKREVAIERDKAILELRAAVTEATVKATERIVDSVAGEALNGRMVTKYLGDLEKAVK
jgi:F-type H+-transporting ATPase subunit b